MNELIQEIKDHFNEFEITLTDKFNISTFSKRVELLPVDLVIACCNIEDTKVMKEIAEGNYENFKHCS